MHYTRLNCIVWNSDVVVDTIDYIAVVMQKQYIVYYSNYWYKGFLNIHPQKGGYQYKNSNFLRIKFRLFEFEFSNI